MDGSQGSQKPGRSSSSQAALGLRTGARALMSDSGRANSSPSGASVFPQSKRTRPQRRRGNSRRGSGPVATHVGHKHLTLPTVQHLLQLFVGHHAGICCRGKGQAQSWVRSADPVGQTPQLTDLQLPPNPLHILLPVFRLHQVAFVDELHELLGQDPVLRMENIGWAPRGGFGPGIPRVQRANSNKYRCLPP